MIQPEISLPSSVEAAVRNTCLYTILDSANESAEPVFAEIRGDRINYKKVVETDSTPWDVSYIAGNNRKGNSLILSNDQERIFFRSYLRFRAGAAIEEHEVPHYSDHVELFDTMTAVQLNAGHVIVRSLFEPRFASAQVRKFVSIESMRPIDHKQAFRTLRKTSAAILELAATSPAVS